MNRKAHIHIIFTFLGLGSILLSGVRCDKGANPPPFTGPLELLQPKGGSGQSFKVGDTVRIKWSIHDTNAVRSIGIVYSIDTGNSWSGFYIGGRSFDYPETTYVWTPTNQQKSDQFVLKVIGYFDETINDKSAPFIIH